MIFKAKNDLKLKDFSQTSSSLWKRALVSKVWENLATKSTVRFHREGEVNFDNSMQRWTINGHTVQLRFCPVSHFRFCTDFSNFEKK